MLPKDVKMVYKDAFNIARRELKTNKNKAASGACALFTVPLFDGSGALGPAFGECPRCSAAALLRACLVQGGLPPGCIRRSCHKQLEERTAHRASRARRSRPQSSRRQGPRTRSTHSARTLAGIMVKRGDVTAGVEWRLQEGCPSPAVGPCLEIRPLQTTKMGCQGGPACAASL